MKRFVWLAAFSAIALAPGAAAGQEDAREPGTSLSLSPFGGTAIGVWRRLSPRMELGIVAGATVGTREIQAGDQQTEQEHSIVSVEPAVKLYGSGWGDLRPYGIGSVFYQRSHREAGEAYDATENAVGATVGMGLEWTPAPRVRIGGHAGLRGNVFEESITSNASYEETGWNFSTFTSGLTIYYAF